MMKDKIDAVEKQMKARLEEMRATFNHAGNKGESVEIIFRRFLRDYLPRRLEIGHGEIIDSHGNTSAQTDVVVVTEDHPFTFTPDQPGLFFIEGISAAGEIKTNLTSTELTESIDKSRRFKQLQAAPFTGILMSNGDDSSRFLGHPHWFIFAFESQVSLDAIKGSVEGYMSDNSVSSNEILDGIFVMDRGSVIDYGDGSGTLHLVDEQGEALPGWQSYRSNSVAFDHLMWLSTIMLTANSPILPHYLLPNDCSE